MLATSAQSELSPSQQSVREMLDAKRQQMLRRRNDSSSVSDNNSGERDWQARKEEKARLARQQAIQVRFVFTYLLFGGAETLQVTPLRTLSFFPWSGYSTLLYFALRYVRLLAVHSILHLLALVVGCYQLPLLFLPLVLSRCWRQEEHPACKNWVIKCWCGYLSGARCRLFA